MMLSVVFVFFLMPETKGIPLEAMNRLFSREMTKGFRVRKANKNVLAELAAEERALRVGLEEKAGIVHEEEVLATETKDAV